MGNIALGKQCFLMLGLLFVVLFCASCGGGGGGEGEIPQDPTICPTPSASLPTGIHPFVDSTITVANGETLWRSAGVDGNSNPLWIEEPSPFRITGEGQYEFKATKAGLSESQVLKVAYTSYTWRLAGLQGEVSSADVKSLSMAVDNMGKPYVAYSQNGFISVKYFNGGSWVLVGAPDFIRSDDAIIAVDGDAPYLAYVDAVESIHVKKWDGGVWIDMGGTAGRASSSGNSNGNHHFCFDVSNGNPYTLSLSPITGENTLYRFAGSSWAECGPGLTQTYYYFAMDAANGKPYIMMANKGARSRILLYENGWIDLVNPNETPVLNCTVDNTNIRIANNHFNVDLSVDEKTNTLYFIGDSIKGSFDDFVIKVVRGGRVIDVAGIGSDDPDELNIKVFNGRAVLAYEDHDNYVGYDPAGFNFEFLADGDGNAPSSIPANKEDSGIAYIDGCKFISLAGGGDRLFVAFSDTRLGGRITVLTYTP